MAPYINWTKLTFIKYLIQQQHHKHSFQVHMEHSPIRTTFWAIKPTLTDLKEYVSHKVCSRTIMELKVNNSMKIPKYLEIKQHTPK